MTKLEEEKKKLKESSLQRWFVEKVENHDIAAAIDGVDDLIALRDALFNDKRAAAAVNDALNALACLEEPDLVSAGRDIKVSPNEQFEPDLLLHDPNSSRWVIVELKVNHTSERQAITEVLAYAEAITRDMPNVMIAIVIASADWRPLLRAAVRDQLGRGRYPLLPLMVTPSNTGESFSLRPCLDLFKPGSAGTPYNALQFSCTTSSFSERPTMPAPALDHEAIDHRLTMAISDIAHEGARKNCSGLAIYWQSTIANRPVWHITTCVINPNLIELKLPEESRIKSYLDKKYGLSTLSVDVELLKEVSLDDMGCMQEFNSYGDWCDAQQLINYEEGITLAVVPWGDIRERWETAQIRAQMRRRDPIIFAGLHEGDPLHWMPQMDAICGEALTLDDMESGVGAYKLGKVMARLEMAWTGSLKNPGNSKSHKRHALAKFIGAWHVVHEYAAAVQMPLHVPRLHFDISDPSSTDHSVRGCLSLLRLTEN